MKGRLTLQQRLILPIILLGLITLLSNILAVFSINNVHANAGTIVDKSMVSEERLDDIRRSVMDIHRLALSHIVAEDHATMIRLVQEIKAEEAALDEKLGAYQEFVSEKEREAYQSLQDSYGEFKHALVYLVSASADSKTQDAYALANGDVASFADAMDADIDALNASISQQTLDARSHLAAVYLLSLVVGIVAAIVCIILVFADVKLITSYVVLPLKSMLKTIQESSGSINHMTGEVLKKTRVSRKSAAGLSALAGQLSSTFREVAGNVSAINDSAGTVSQDVRTMAQECSSISAYTVQMNTRADAMQQSALSSAQITGVKTEEIMRSLNDAIEKSKSVNQIKNLTGEILAIAQQTRLISLNASVEAANAGPAGKGFAMVAREVRELSNSTQETANRIQDMNNVVTAAVSNLSENARNLVDYMSHSVLQEFQAFVQSGSQYKEDAAYIRGIMDEFHERTQRLNQSMAGIADSIGTITRAVGEGASGIAGMADSTKNLAADMEDITQHMGANQEVVAGLEEKTVMFDNL